MSGLTIAAILAELEQDEPGLVELAAGRPDREVHAVWLAEELREVEQSPKDALVVLSKAASREATGTSSMSRCGGSVTSRGWSSGRRYLGYRSARSPWQSGRASR